MCRVRRPIRYRHVILNYVILSRRPSRAIKSPQILELSVIGRKELLESIGVPIRMELPGVGENMQEHPLCGMYLSVEEA